MAIKRSKSMASHVLKHCVKHIIWQNGWMRFQFELVLIQ